jgi:hypothetical protein
MVCVVPRMPLLPSVDWVVLLQLQLNFMAASSSSAEAAAAASAAPAAVAAPQQPLVPSYDLYWEDHPGFTLPGAMKPIPVTSVGACATACWAQVSCVGFVYTPLTNPATNKSCVDQQQQKQPTCILKEWFGPGRRVGNGCTQSALVRSNPAVPPGTQSVVASVRVVNSAAAAWPVSNDSMGCHFDSGYAHQPQLLHSQMLWGGSFEFGRWLTGRLQPQTLAGTSISLKPPVVEAISGAAASMEIHLAPSSLRGSNQTYMMGGVFVGAANRGIGNAGLLFRAGKAYEGYVLVSSNSSVSFSVRLEDYATNSSAGGPTILAEQFLSFAGGNWSKVSFTLSPSQSTTCRAIPFGAAGTDVKPCGVGGSHQRWDAHMCMECGGQFSIGLTAAGSARFGAIMLQPGQWGRLRGLPVASGAATRLQEIGVSLIRVGGTFAINEFNFWQHWRGPPESRPPAVWRDSLMTGFGPFEVADMAEELGMKFIYTTSAACNKGLCIACNCVTNPATPAAMAGLVEYSFGNASTTLGKQRIADGRRRPYLAMSHIELGTISAS